MYTTIMVRTQLCDIVTPYISVVGMTSRSFDHILVNPDKHIIAQIGKHPLNQN